MSSLLFLCELNLMFGVDMVFEVWVRTLRKFLALSLYLNLGAASKATSVAVALCFCLQAFDFLPGGWPLEAISVHMGAGNPTVCFLSFFHGCRACLWIHPILQARHHPLHKPWSSDIPGQDLHPSDRRGAAEGRHNEAGCSDNYSRD